MELMFVLPQFAESSLMQDYQHVAHARKPKLLMQWLRRGLTGHEVKSQFADDWSKVKKPDYNLLKTYEVDFSKKKNTDRFTRTG